MSKKGNIIQKIFIDVQKENSSDAFKFKNELSDVCKYKFLPELEKLFDEKIPKDKILRIKEIVIEAGDIQEKNWKDEFVKKVINRFKDYLESDILIKNVENIISENYIQDRINIITQDENNIRSIIHFLETGALPWNTMFANFEELQTEFQNLVNKKDESFLNELLQHLHSNAAIAERLVYQFDRKIIEKLLLVFFPGRNIVELLKIYEFILSELNFTVLKLKHIVYQSALLLPVTDSSDTLNEIFARHIIEKLSIDQKEVLMVLLRKKRLITQLEGKVSKEIFEEVLMQIYEQLTRKTDAIVEVELIEKKKDKIKNKYEEGFWYINNSGLVILHPFLVKLFENTGYIENRMWINEEVQQRAILLTQYLVTGKEEYPEFDLLLNKILCGYEIDKSLPRDIKLSEFEKNEAEDLLHSVIKHWNALKNTSAAGLRETFLKRDGKLSYRNQEWFLEIEQKTVDILLNKLPWGKSIIKMPWMKNFLKVEWNN